MLRGKYTTHNAGVQF